MKDRTFLVVLKKNQKRVVGEDVDGAKIASEGTKKAIEGLIQQDSQVMDVENSGYKLNRKNRRARY